MSSLDCQRVGFVSVWVGTFPTVEAAEAYFGVPDEIGVPLPPEQFAQDLGLDEIPGECLEVNFEQITPRPLAALLQDATYSPTFLDQTVEAAGRQNVHAAQGVALLYDFDYENNPTRRRVIGPLRFIGTFPFIGDSPVDQPTPRRDPSITVREIGDDVL